MTNKLMYFVGNWKMFGNFASIKIVNNIHSFISKTKKLHRMNKIILCINYILIDVSKVIKMFYCSFFSYKLAN